MMGPQIMTDDMLSGEARDRAKNRRLVWLFASLALAGGFVGFTFARFETKNGVTLGGTIPSALAIVLAAATFVAMVWGTLVSQRRIDEVVLRDNIYAGARGAFTVLVRFWSATRYGSCCRKTVCCPNLRTWQCTRASLS